MKTILKCYLVTAMVAAIAFCLTAESSAKALAQEKKPNILIIWGDDIGQFNTSAYNDGSGKQK